MNRSHPSAALKSLMVLHFQQNQVQIPPYTWRGLYKRSHHRFPVLPPTISSITQSINPPITHHLTNKQTMHTPVSVFTHYCLYLECSPPILVKEFLFVTTCSNKLSLFLPWHSSKLRTLLSDPNVPCRSLSRHLSHHIVYMTTSPQGSELAEIRDNVLFKSAILGPGTESDQCFNSG